MRLTSLAAAAAAAVVAIAFAVPADAQSRRPDPRAPRVAPTPIQPTTTIYRTPEGRRYVVVHRRSYLDAGTEVYPGSQRYLDYVFPPGYSAYNIIYPSDVYKRYPLPGPFELGSFRAPDAY
jgi:hypothetical protein